MYTSSMQTKFQLPSHPATCVPTHQPKCLTTSQSYQSLYLYLPAGSYRHDPACPYAHHRGQFSCSWQSAFTAISFYSGGGVVQMDTNGMEAGTQRVDLTWAHPKKLSPGTICRAYTTPVTMYTSVHKTRTFAKKQCSTFSCWVLFGCLALADENSILESTLSIERKLRLSLQDLARTKGLKTTLDKTWRQPWAEKCDVAFVFSMVAVLYLAILYLLL